MQPAKTEGTRVEVLEQRLHRLAGEKAFLQLIVGLMNHLSVVPGLENLVSSLLRGLLDTIGGEDAWLYYAMDGHLVRAGLRGPAVAMAAIDDELAARAREGGHPLEEARGLEETRMTGDRFPKAYCWAWPLRVGSETVGVVRIENLHVALAELGEPLATFFSYAALMLRNEILSQTRLTQAYTQLKAAHAELEERVRRRTLALAESNRALERESQVRAALAELYKPLAAPDSTLGDIAQVVVEQASQLTGAPLGYVAEIVAADGAGPLVLDFGRPGRHVRIPRAPAGQYPGLWGHSLNTGVPFFTNQPEAEGELPLAPGHAAIESYLAVPVHLAGELVGQVALANRPGGFTPADLAAVARLASYFALAFRRKRADETIRHLASFPRLSPVLVCEFDRAMRLLFANPAMETALRLSGIGEAAAFVPEDWRQRLAAGPEAGPEEVRELEVAGRHWEARFIFIPDYQSLRVYVSDITGRVEAEQQQATLRQHLVQAQKMEALGRLAGGVAHDFNNLLTVINGYGEIALGRLHAEDPLAADLRMIRAAGLRAAELTRQLLTFSRQQVSEPAVLDLNEQVREMERMLDRVIGEDIELECRLDSELGAVRMEPGQVHQVLMNLCVNARDAMPEGGRLAIETLNVEVDLYQAARHWTIEPGSYVVLSVSDSGVGMSAEVQTRIFEPFFTTKEPGKGTGMGLATVFGIVQQAGGTISVYSEPGEGTTFRIYLPRLERAPAAAPVKAERRRGEQQATVLVVEDQAEVRQLLCALLRSLGYEVLETGSGAEALTVAERFAGPIHLLVSDVVMPQMSGPAVAAQVCAARPETRVLFVSGYPENLGLRHAEGIPPFDYLQKPFTLDALAAKVEAILERG